eukprot:CAMPEP_0196730178 /NCGR_PEP_ID=MMETSP1091-20130531/10307_1 /TAXON_ID=302021 /ORGANISM="Rhodomonas sp., Strain CCMP768" /LENGTH=47 /DNA_ID= /DNA_START= /DNA_END= /DNA_ORIENTATION=
MSPLSTPLSTPPYGGSSAGMHFLSESSSLTQQACRLLENCPALLLNL